MRGTNFETDKKLKRDISQLERVREKEKESNIKKALHRKKNLKREKKDKVKVEMFKLG